MSDLDGLTDPEFDRLMAECGLDDRAHLLRVAALVDEARIRERIPDVARPRIDSRRVLDLYYYGGKAFDF